MNEMEDRLRPAPDEDARPDPGQPGGKWAASAGQWIEASVSEGKLAPQGQGVYPGFSSPEDCRREVCRGAGGSRTHFNGFANRRPADRLRHRMYRSTVSLS